MHPRHEHMTASLKDPERLLEQRVAVGRESGVPEELLQYYREAGTPVERRRRRARHAGSRSR